MRTIARRLVRLLADHGVAVSAILGAVVGALLGDVYEPRQPTHTIPARGAGSYSDDRLDWPVRATRSNLPAWARSCQ